METDTASYFLTVNPAGNNKRFTIVSNNTAGTTLVPERNFMHTVRRIFRGYINYGAGVFYPNQYGGVDKLFLSSYDNGEGLASRPITGTSPISHTFTSMYVDTLGKPMTLMVDMAGSMPNYRSIKISLNNDSLTGFQLPYFEIIKFTMPGIDPRKIKNNAAAFLVQDVVSGNDDCRIGKLFLEYPRTYNFGGESSFEFYVDGSEQGRYLKISNFNKGTASAVLYDFTNNKRYTGNAGLGDTLEFVLEPSAAQYHLLLVRSDGSTAKIINTIEQKNFVDFSSPDKQGDYLIITNPLLYGSGTENYIDQ
jgi:hypothetical protein